MTPHRPYGILQSDVLIRSAIVQAIYELRANPWLLDYCFAYLRYDDLTKEAYGPKEIEEAKKWFLSTNIDVRLAELAEEPKFPMINIQLSESQEDRATLGDVHYDPIIEEDPYLVGQTPETIYGPFTPSSYDPETGIMTLPTLTRMEEGQILFDNRSNTGYPIEEIIPPFSIRIAKGILGDFRDATVIPRFSTRLVEMESLMFRETYTMGVHASGHHRFTLYLHSILVFILLRWKQALLEARGFERTTIGSGILGQNEYFSGGPEVVYSRTVQITGYVRQYWPKLITVRPEFIDSVILADGNLITCPGFGPDDQPF